jgi:hypothetical protein
VESDTKGLSPPKSPAHSRSSIRRLRHRGSDVARENRRRALAGYEAAGSQDPWLRASRSASNEPGGAVPGTNTPGDPIDPYQERINTIEQRIIHDQAQHPVDHGLIRLYEERQAGTSARMNAQRTRYRYPNPRPVPAGGSSMPMPPRPPMPTSYYRPYLATAPNVSSSAPYLTRIVY